MGMLIIKHVTIGEGAPKVVVPLVGKTEKEILREAAVVKTHGPDIVEWRADFFEEVENITAVLAVVQKLRNFFSEELLLFTFRSFKEGGNREMDDEYYLELNQLVIQTGAVDLVDVELFSKEETVKALISKANEFEVYIMMSNHDFVQTPSKQEIIARLKKMHRYGADLLKIAVMPQSVDDVLTLLDATNTMKRESEAPIVTISMGKLGIISRLAGEVFGSDLSFGSVKAASAPGQIPIEELRQVLHTIHKYTNQ